MVRVSVRRNEQGQVIAFRVVGHAEFADFGQDVVCAGVSAVVQTTVMGLQRRLGQPLLVRKRPGLLECRLTGDRPHVLERSQDLLETMLLGIQQLSKQFPLQVRVQDEGGAEHAQPEH